MLLILVVEIQTSTLVMVNHNNAANIPMPLSNASPNFGLASSGIKNQIIASAQRAYFDNNVLFGPEYSYQSLYNGEHMNTLTLDLSVYI